MARFKFVLKKRLQTIGILDRIKKKNETLARTIHAIRQLKYGTLTLPSLMANESPVAQW